MGSEVLSENGDGEDSVVLNEIQFELDDDITTTIRKGKIQKANGASRIWKSTGRFDILLLFLLSTSYIRQPSRILSISKTHPKMSFFFFECYYIYIWKTSFF